MGCGSPPDEDRMSHGCIQMDTDKTEGQERPDPGEETWCCGGREADLTSDIVSSICDEPCSSDAEAGLAGGEQEAVTELGSAARHEENCQNKPTAERPAVVEMGPCVEGPEGNEATSAHRPDRESDDSGSATRPAASVDEGARPDWHANSMIAVRSSPGGGGPPMDRYWGELASGWLDSPPGRI
jgi:hypothetical protein